MGGPIGCAADFWRLRVTTMDDASTPDFEWREDILYRTPPADTPEERERYVVEAVSVDDPERVVRLDAFDDPDRAREWLMQAVQVLGEMTRRQFEDEYFPQGEGVDR